MATSHENPTLTETLEARTIEHIPEDERHGRCVLIPWTAVNLVDYYLLRHGDYDIDSLFESDGGIYGKLNVPAVGCYVLGILVQLPFLSNTLYTGPIAKAMNGVDISWIVGLAVICPVYYFWAKAARSSHVVLAADATV